MKNFRATYTKQPWRNFTQQVRGICQYDVLNPCYDNRPGDIPGKHWGGGSACSACTAAATKQDAGR